MHDADSRREPFELAHVGVRALVDARGTGCHDQRLGDRVAPAIATRRRQLDDDRVCIAVGDDSGQAVGFAMDDSAPGMARVQHRAPRGDGARDPTHEERAVDGLARIECPDARPDLRCRRVGGAGDERATCGHDVDGGPGRERIVEGCERAREYPRVPLQQ